MPTDLTPSARPVPVPLEHRCPPAFVAWLALAALALTPFVPTDRAADAGVDGMRASGHPESAG